MTELFLRFLNVSIAASWIVPVVLLLRLALRKAPKWCACILWGIVALRLMLPFAPESALSLIPSPEVIPQDIVSSETPAIHSGIPVVNSAVNPLFTGSAAPERGLLDKILFISSVVWLGGMGVMLLYGLITAIRIRHRVRESILYQKNIYVCDNVASPFIFGIFRPRIYLPSGMEESHLQFVLAHENAHIHRWDHLWKPLGYFLLTVYWFNPLLWLAYILLCRDIEMACDEKVVTHMNGVGKRDYSEALIACSVHRRMVLACPVAFGELSVKARIKGVLTYKKPAIWVIAAAVAASFLMAACFLTDPVSCDHDYESTVTVAATCTEKGVETRTCRLCEHTYTAYIDLCEHSYDAGVVTEAPTCTKTGRRKQICTYCKAEKWTDEAMLPHTPGVPFSVREPNCTEEGEKTATCTVCRAVFTAEILPVNDLHDLKETVLRESTCAVPGEGVNACTRCSYSETITYETVAHKYKDGDLRILPTCIETGTQDRVCTDCGHRTFISIPTVGHCWLLYSLDGRYECKMCGKVKYGDKLMNTTPASLDSMYKPGPNLPDDWFPIVIFP